MVLPLDLEQKRFEIPVSEKPEGLICNPRQEVLAEVLEIE
jgi:hypothetical protein